MFTILMLVKSKYRALWVWVKKGDTTTNAPSHDRKQPTNSSIREPSIICCNNNKELQPKWTTLQPRQLGWTLNWTHEELPNQTIWGKRSSIQYCTTLNNPNEGLKLMNQVKVSLSSQLSNIERYGGPSNKVFGSWSKNWPINPTPLGADTYLCYLKPPLAVLVTWIRQMMLGIES